MVAKKVANKIVKKGLTKIRLPLLIFGIIAISMIAILVIIAYNTNQVRQQTNDKIQIQSARINDVSNDMKAVYDELVKSLPNVKLHIISKSCGRSSDVVGNGTISCGAYGSILFDNVANTGEFVSLRTHLQEVTKLMFIYDSVGSLTEDSINRKQTASNILTSVNGFRCNSYDDYYQTVSDYNYDKSQSIEFVGGAYLWNISCYEISKDFLPGFERR